MGCGQTLFVAEGGWITCSMQGCPNPTAVASVLEETETEHVVTLRESDFTVRHPLRERLDDQIDSCALHAYLRNLEGPPSRPGRYRVSWPSNHWEEIR